MGLHTLPTEGTNTRVEIDLSAIASNIDAIKAITNAKVMAVVKANGYGHGAVQVAEAAVLAGAEWLGVARISEGISLRKAGIVTPILVLGYVPLSRFAEAAQHDVALTVWSEEHIQTAVMAHRASGKKVQLHIKVNTGMNRLGAYPDEIWTLIEMINNDSGLVLAGIFTHFACASERDPAPTVLQAERFDQLVLDLRGQIPETALFHAANSATTLTNAQWHYDMVRIGIAMYGLHPSSVRQVSDEFAPALRWKTVVSMIKEVPAGEGISYGHIYRTTNTERIATIPVGYADGYRRTTGNVVLVNGVRCPVVGRVCMDQILVNVDDAGDVNVGGEVVLLGSQGADTISAEEIANRWRTNNYEVVCGISARVQRVFV